MRCLRAVSLLVVSWRRLELGQLCYQGVLDAVVFGRLTAQYAVGRDGRDSSKPSALDGTSFGDDPLSRLVIVIS